MKRRFMWRLVSSDGISVTGFFKNERELRQAENENPDWKRQRVLVIG